MQTEKTVFISYRRTNAMTARAVYQDLTHHGYDCFLDYENIDAGAFERIILNQIAARAHFIVILTPSALERCADPNDWLRREIEYALDMKRNIVPLMFDRFDFGDIQQYLVGKLAVLSQYNALEIPPAYFDAAMDKLRSRFLNKTLDVILHPTPKEDESAVQQAQANEAAQPAVQETQLTAEQWVERGSKRDQSDYDGKIADYTEAIRLNPQYAEAYYRRGNAHADKGEMNGAISDYTEAISIEPNANRYYNRGTTYDDMGDLDEAISDYNEAIRLDPKHVSTYVNRAGIRLRKRNWSSAIADCNEAMRLNPESANAYRNRGIAHENGGDFWQANADFQKYIDLGGKEAELVRGWIRKNEEQLRKRGG